MEYHLLDTAVTAINRFLLDEQNFELCLHQCWVERKGDDNHIEVWFNYDSTGKYVANFGIEVWDEQRLSRHESIIVPIPKFSEVALKLKEVLGIILPSNLCINERLEEFYNDIK